MDFHSSLTGRNDYFVNIFTKGRYKQDIFSLACTAKTNVFAYVRNKIPRCTGEAIGFISYQGKETVGVLSIREKFAFRDANQRS